MSIDFAPLAVVKDEPLRLELEEFFECVATRRVPRSPANKPWQLSKSLKHS